MTKEILLKVYLRYRIIIFPVLVGISSLILIATIVYPQLKDFLAGQESIREQKERTLNLEAKASDLVNINEVKVSENLKYALSALPQTQDYTSLVGVFQRLAVQAGLNLNSLQLGTSQIQIPGVSGFAVKLDVEGSSSGIANLLVNIDKGSRVLRVESVEVSRGAGSLLNGSVLVDVFFAPTPKELGSLDQALPKISAEDEQILSEIASLIPQVATQSPEELPQRGKANPFE